uniref:Uncharacterized protein n=1 Tax=Trichuris muris TaxID=70415 RepID=A0A5S6Q784_TRIMR
MVRTLGRRSLVGSRTLKAGVKIPKLLFAGTLAGKKDCHARSILPAIAARRNWQPAAIAGKLGKDKDEQMGGQSDGCRRKKFRRAPRRAKPFIGGELSSFWSK